MPRHKIRTDKNRLEEFVKQFSDKISIDEIDLTDKELEEYLNSRPSEIRRQNAAFNSDASDVINLITASKEYLQELADHESLKEFRERKGIDIYDFSESINERLMKD